MNPRNVTVLKKNQELKNVIPFKEKRGKATARRVCFLCGHPYASSSKFDRFCDGCRQSNELYHFHEWLPAS